MVAVRLSEHLTWDTDTDRKPGLSLPLPSKVGPFKPSPGLPQDGFQTI